MGNSYSPIPPQSAVGLQSVAECASLSCHTVEPPEPALLDEVVVHSHHYWHSLSTQNRNELMIPMSQKLCHTVEHPCVLKSFLYSELTYIFHQGSLLLYVQNAENIFKITIWSQADKTSSCKLSQITPWDANSASKGGWGWDVSRRMKIQINYTQ